MSRFRIRDQSPHLEEGGEEKIKLTQDKTEQAESEDLEPGENFSHRKIKAAAQQFICRRKAGDGATGIQLGAFLKQARAIELFSYSHELLSENS